jgi:hypothetical protein
MKSRILGYWVTTALVALASAFGGVMDLLRPPDLVAGMTHLGYPAYFLLILGAWKVLGAAALLAPRLPLLKEWAYAGMVFDLTGASLSHFAVGDPAPNVVTPLVLLGLVAASWVLRPDSRRLAGASLRRPASTAAAEPARAHAAA